VVDTMPGTASDSEPSLSCAPRTYRRSLDFLQLSLSPPHQLHPVTCSLRDASRSNFRPLPRDRRVPFTLDHLRPSALPRTRLNTAQRAISPSL
jgi:hypothetical protein